MPTDVPIRCACGAFRGIARGLAPGRGNRVVCYCDDCQSFAHALDRADTVLDRNGGTDIFQMSPARLEITEGAEQLACLRLTRSGLLRWHTACCNTAIGNTARSSKLPFIGLIHTCLDHGLGEQARDDALGPIRMRVAARFAKGELGGVDAHPKTPLSMAFRLGPIVLLGRIRGDHKRSPFFDPETGEPRANPRVLSAEELRAVEAARDA